MSMGAGANGPLLLQDSILSEKMAHFNREGINERVVMKKEPALLELLPLHMTYQSISRPRYLIRLESIQNF